MVTVQANQNNIYFTFVYVVYYVIAPSLSFLGWEEYMLSNNK